MRPYGERTRGAAQRYSHPLLRGKDVRRLMRDPRVVCLCCEGDPYNDNAAKSRGRRGARRDIEEQLKDDRAA